MPTTVSIGLPEAWAALIALEGELGAPEHSGAMASFEAALAHDEREAYPEALCAHLIARGFYAQLVPRALGGELDTLEGLFGFLRGLSRRDPTAAIALGKTFLGFVPVWLAGTPEQCERVAARLLAGAQMALGLSEQQHGSDVLASEVVARRVGETWQLEGRKWPINNATRCEWMTVFARTDEAGGPRGFTAMLVDKRALAPGSYEHLPRAKTHGIRGADISGIAFHGATCEPLGAPGSGLEVVLKALQVTRLMCTAFSLGAADTALRVTLQFARERRLYGQAVWELAHARATVVGAYADWLVAEALALAAVRLVQAAPEQASLLSAAAKYVVPTVVEAGIERLAVVLGARSYLREGPTGIFQKMARDARVVSLFDGNTVVNLEVVALQLRAIAQQRDRSGARSEAAGLLAAALDLQRRSPPLAVERLALSGRGQDLLGFGLLDASQQLADPEATPALADDTRGLLLAQVEALVARQRDLDGRAGGSLARGVGEKGRLEPLALAETACFLQAAGACLQLYCHNQASEHGFFADGRWLALALERVADRLGLVGGPELPLAWHDALALRLCEQADRGALFSLFDVPLAPAGTPRRS